MRANPLQGLLEGVGPENRDFLAPPPLPQLCAKNVKNVEKNGGGGFVGASVVPTYSSCGNVRS
jgi:hypothetical protein